MKLYGSRACAGQCGRSIAGRLWCCPVCWRRLPLRFRAAIAAGDRNKFETSIEAKSAAVHWFTHHPIARRLAAKGVMPAQ